MSKYLKSLIAVCLIACMTVCLSLFAAACKNDSFPSSVSITVMCDEDTPAVDVTVQICTVPEDGDAGMCLDTIKTNAQGVATFELDEANGKNYEVHLYNIPKGYQYVDETGAPYANAGKKIDVTESSSVTITLSKVESKTVIKEGATNLTIESAKQTLDLTVDIKTSGWYDFSISEPFNITVNGVELEDVLGVVLYLNNNDKLSVTFNINDETIEFPLANNSIGLTLLGTGTTADPVKVTADSAMVLNLTAGQTICVANDYVKKNGGFTALDVTGTNFKVSYKDDTNITEKFKFDASTGSLTEPVYEKFTVGTANGETGVVTLNFAEYEEPVTPPVVGGDLEGKGTESDPFIAPLNKKVEFDCPAAAPGFDGISVKFVAPEAGTYRITYSEDCYIIPGNEEYDFVEVFEGCDNPGSEGYVDVTLTEGYELMLNFSTFSYAANTLSATITKIA
ncbi:MAG: hypothetical protein K2K38_06290 [Clostridia bacterium]|nr:hypothetical protein [Clostridia bacterium]